MPLGNASIIGDVGSIEADDPPSPVSFIPSKYPTVDDGMRVYFERRSDDATKAKTVRPASAGDQLVSLVAPSFGLTTKAKGLIAATAHNLSATIAHKPGKSIAGVAAFKKPVAQMTILATKLEAHGARVGIAMVRIAVGP